MTGNKPLEWLLLDGFPMSALDSVSAPSAPSSALEPLRSPALEALKLRAREELRLTRYPHNAWLPELESPDAAPIYNVVIVGAGQSGVSAAAALTRHRVDPVLVLDRNPAGYEGPWMTYARMPTLRSPKFITGLELGIPSATPEAWYRTLHGDAAWDSIEKISRHDWAQYLLWYRDLHEIPVRNETELTAFHFDAARQLLRLEITSAEGPAHLWARRLVFANGIEGCGEWAVPEVVTKALPPERYASTSTDVDFAALAGKRVGVLGAGASAFDNAGRALEAGATRVDLCYRRSHLPRVNPNRWMENAGFLAHFIDMSDAWKWKFYFNYWSGNQPPPQTAYDRCAPYEHFHLHPSTAWDSVEEKDGAIEVRAGEKTFHFDYIISATGLRFDLSLRPELAPYADAIASWGDRYTPPPELAHAGYATMPYTGRGFEFLGKEPGALPWEGRVFCFNSGANLSMGVLGSAISGMKYGLRYLADGVGRSFFLEGLEYSLEDLLAYDEPELVAPAHV